MKLHCFELKCIEFVHVFEKIITIDNGVINDKNVTYRHRKKKKKISDNEDIRSKTIKKKLRESCVIVLYE